MRRALSLACACALAPIISHGHARADDAKASPSLDEVTVYATRTPQVSFDVPAIVSKVDLDSPGTALSSDMSDLLEFVPGVEVDNGPRRTGQTVSIRGIDAEGVITLIDGRRQNFEAAHDGRFYLDPSLLKSVEIVKGASSSIYGGGGIGGVIAFDTKDAADLLAPGQKIGAHSALGYRTANDDHLATVASYGRADNWDILGSATYRYTGDIRQGDGDRLETEERIGTGLMKVGYTFLDYNTLKFQGQILRNDGKEPNNPSGTISSTSNPVVDKLIDDRQVGLKYTYDNPDNLWLQPTAHVYFNDTMVEEVTRDGSSKGRIDRRAIETLGVTLDNKTKLEIAAGHSHTFSYGVEAYSDGQDGHRSTASDESRPGVPDANAVTYGFYLQDEISLKTAFGDFLIIPSARYDHYDSDDNDGNQLSKGRISPKLAASYKPIENVVLFGSWAQAFRAPNMTEVYAAGQHYFGNNFVSNTDLQPEVVTTIELGVGSKFAGLATADDRLQLKTSVYKSIGDNFITQEITSTTTQYVNIANAQLIGFDGSLSYEIDPFKAIVGASYTEAVDKDTDEYLSNNVPLTLTLDVSSKIDIINSVIGWRSRFAKANGRIQSDETLTEGYGVHDLYFRWRPDQKKWGELTFDFGIDNIFDKDYSKRYASLMEEGRSYNVRMNYTW